MTYSGPNVLLPNVAEPPGLNFLPYRLLDFILEDKFSWNRRGCLPILGATDFSLVGKWADSPLFFDHS
jgi:hypothetical protein